MGVKMLAPDGVKGALSPWNQSMTLSKQAGN